MLVLRAIPELLWDSVISSAVTTEHVSTMFVNVIRATVAHCAFFECSGHETCLYDDCVCSPCYSGPRCGVECSDHGYCNGAARPECICDMGWEGAHCQNVDSYTNN